MTRLSMLLVLALSACSSESRRAQQELDIIYASGRDSTIGRSEQNARLCAGYRKLQDAYLKEGNQEEYHKAEMPIVAYC